MWLVTNSLPWGRSWKQECLYPNRVLVALIFPVLALNFSGCWACNSVKYHLLSTLESLSSNPTTQKKGIFLTYPVLQYTVNLPHSRGVLTHNLKGGMLLGKVTTVKQASLAGFPHPVYEQRLHNEVSIFRPGEWAKAPGSLSLSCHRYFLCVSCNILYNKRVNLFPGPRTPISEFVIGM